MTVSQPSAGAAPPILAVQGLTKRFGGVVAVDGFDMAVQRRQIFSIIGPNGAGKSTLFNLISGIIKPGRGRVLLDGNDVTGLPPHVLVRRGLARTFQNIRLFKEMTVLENVMIAFHCRTSASLLDVMLSLPSERRERREVKEKAEALLELVQLTDRRHDRAPALAYGAQRRLEVARALATKPRLLILDEPTAGMNEHEVSEMIRLILSIREQDRTVLLIEHNMPVVMGISDRVAVLSFGRKLAEGTSEEIRNDPEVIKAYLGESTRTPPRA